MKSKVNFRRSVYYLPFAKLVVIALLSATFLFGCVSNNSEQTQSTDELPLVATFSVLSDLLQNVGGNALSITTLVGHDSDAHTFEPSPKDSVALLDATLVFENGANFESWLDDLYSASQSVAKRVKVSQGIELQILETGESDPHVWHDVGNAMSMVKNIQDALIEADPDHAALYRANAEDYLAQLQQLDDWIVAEVAKLPADQRKLVTTHDTFGYFARRYGFEIIGTGLASISTESADPAAAQVVALVEEIKAAGIPAIFVENVSNPELMQRIASEAAVTVAPPLYTDALGAVGSDGDTYIKMVRYNVTTIVTALNENK